MAEVDMLPTELKGLFLPWLLVAPRRLADGESWLSLWSFLLVERLSLLLLACCVSCEDRKGGREAAYCDRRVQRFDGLLSLFFSIGLSILAEEKDRVR